MKLLGPDDGSAKEAVEPAFASGVAFADVAGTRGNAFEENESDREPRRSISTLLEVVGEAEILEEVGAAVKKHKDVMSTKPSNAKKQALKHRCKIFKTINIKLKPQMTSSDNMSIRAMPLKVYWTKVMCDWRIKPTLEHKPCCTALLYYSKYI